VIVSLDKTHFIVWNRLKPFEQFALKLFWTLNRLVPIEVHYMEKNPPGMFSSKTLISFRLKNKINI